MKSVIKKERKIKVYKIAVIPGDGGGGEGVERGGGEVRC